MGRLEAHGFRHIIRSRQGRTLYIWIQLLGRRTSCPGWKHIRLTILKETESVEPCGEDQHLTISDVSPNLL